MIAPGVYLGGKWENVDQMVMAEDDSLRLFLGYSGWAPNQIESKIEAGAWDVYRVDLEKLLSNLDKLAAANSDLLASYLDGIKA